MEQNNYNTPDDSQIMEDSKDAAIVKAINVVLSLIFIPFGIVLAMVLYYNTCTTVVYKEKLFNLWEYDTLEQLEEVEGLEDKYVVIPRKNYKVLSEIAEYDDAKHKVKGIDKNYYDILHNVTKKSIGWRCF